MLRATWCFAFQRKPFEQDETQLFQKEEEKSFENTFLESFEFCRNIDKHKSEYMKKKDAQSVSTIFPSKEYQKKLS